MGWERGVHTAPSLKGTRLSVVVAVVFVIMVIPIAFRVPAMLMFIPPSMTGAPAVLSRFV
jgi:hypothetical protein